MTYERTFTDRLTDRLCTSINEIRKFIWKIQHTLKKLTYKILLRLKNRNRLIISPIMSLTFRFYGLYFEIGALHILIHVPVQEMLFPIFLFSF